MTWHSPSLFWLILPVIIIAGLTYWQRRKKIPTLQFSNLKVLQKVAPSMRSRLMILPLILKTLGLALAVAALARPQTSDTQVKKNVEGIDIMIALDISDSMLIEDMKPNNRLESAKETIQKFVAKRTSDRIGIVIFAGESFTLVPLTLDYELLLSRVAEIQTAQQAHVKDGTAIGVALANAAGRLRDSTAKSRVVIFMTDGENNSGLIDPETGLDVAKGYGVKIYSIGIGKDGPTKIPIFMRDLLGNRKKSYQPFESYVNDDLLGRMASETGGKYWRASKEDSLEGVFNEIDRLEKTKIDVSKFTRYNEMFKDYLFWAMVFYLLGWHLGSIWLRRTP